MKPYTRKFMRGGVHGSACRICCPAETKATPRSHLRRVDLVERTVTDGVLVPVYDPDPELGPDCYHATHDDGHDWDGNPCPCLDCEAVRWLRKGAA